MTEFESKFDLLLSGKATEQQVREFMQWLEIPENRAAFLQYKKIYHSTTGFCPDEQQTGQALADYRAYMRRRRSLPARRSLRYAAVAAVAVIAVVLTIPRGEPAPEQILSTTTVPARGVTLVHSGGQAINILDIGSASMPAGTQIDPDGRSITYATSDTTASFDTFSTIYVSAGERFAVTLSDGTRVWLNSESSLRYPDRFPGDRRNVTLDGEAYFEVAKDAVRPFTVTSRDMDIEVLGTSFNIHNYPDEDFAAMTLVSGSVKISSYGHSITVSPDYQALWDGSGLSQRPVETYNFTAWKNGTLILENVSLGDLTRQLGRWYGKIIICDAEIPAGELFNGRFDRENFETAIRTLTLNLGMKYSIEEDTVRIF